jgi:hypothetical protein
MLWHAATTLVLGPVTAVCSIGGRMSASAAILRGCEAFKASTDFYSTALCTDAETGQKSE